MAIIKGEVCERCAERDKPDVPAEYELQTIKGAVTIRWFGQSNGYYSESVYFEKQ